MLTKICLILLSLVVAKTQGELTEQDIIAREIAWAKRAVRHFQHGFGDGHPLQQWEAVDDDAKWQIPEHVFLTQEDLRPTENLQGG
jgi:hypothetical protein